MGEAKDEPAKLLSNLDLIKECDSFPFRTIAAAQQAGYVPLYLPSDPRPHGYMPPSVVKQMPWTKDFTIASDSVQVNCANTGAACSKAFQDIIDAAVDQGLFPEVLDGKHSELFRILGARTEDGGMVTVERFAGDLFGITARGAHMTVFTRDTKDGKIKIWVPRRALSSFTFPGKLDSTVAGGVPAHQSSWENIVMEAGEEASLPPELLETDARAAGCLTYVGTNSLSKSGDGPGMVGPDVIYVYDLEVGKDVVPKPFDGEVKEFYLMSVEEVRSSMARGQWKPNSAVVMLDFFVRHGFVTAENEGDFVEIVQRMHGALPFPVTGGEGW